MEYLTAKEVRSLLKVSRTTVNRMVGDGTPCIGAGRLRRFPLDGLLAWYAGESESEVASTSEPIMLPAGIYACAGCGFQAAFREPIRVDRMGACKACGGHAVRIGDLPRHM